MQSLPSRVSYQFPSERTSLLHVLFKLLLKATLFLIAEKATACQVADKESQSLPFYRELPKGKGYLLFKKWKQANIYLSQKNGS